MACGALARLHPRYAPTYGSMPFERAASRPLQPSLSLSTSSHDPVPPDSLVPRLDLPGRCIMLSEQYRYLVLVSCVVTILRDRMYKGFNPGVNPMFSRLTFLRNDLFAVPCARRRPDAGARMGHLELPTAEFGGCR